MEVMRRDSLRFLTLVTLFSAGLLAAAPAFATVMVKLSLRDLVGRADRVVIGSVQSTSSRWTKNRRHIITEAVVRVNRTVHGPHAQTVTIRRLGGAVGKIGMRVTGTAILTKGQQVLLFTELRGGARYVVGMSQGAFRLQIAKSGTTTVQRQLSGLLLTTKGPGSVKPAAPTSAASSSATPTTPTAAPKATTTAATTLAALVKQIQTTITQCSQEKNRCRQP